MTSILNDLTPVLAVLLALSLVGNLILSLSRRKHLRTIEYERYSAGFREGILIRHINRLRGLLSRPWIDRHGHLLRAVR